MWWWFGLDHKGTYGVQRLPFEFEPIRILFGSLSMPMAHLKEYN
jgi:hypothetical protein